MQSLKIWTWLIFFFIPLIGIWVLIHATTVTVAKFVEAEADLALQLQTLLPTGQAYPGHRIVYSIIFTNTGPSLVSEAQIIDIVPNQIVVESVTTGGAAIVDTGADPPYVWRVTDLQPNSSGIILITGKITPDITSNVAFTNTAIISSALDTTLSNNQDSSSLTLEVPTIQFAASAYTITEGSGTAWFDVRSNKVNDYADASVTYLTIDGTAQSAVADGTAEERDYLRANGTLTLTAGIDHANVVISIEDDDIAERPETLTLLLQNPRGVMLGASSVATLTIVDDDVAGLRTTETAINMVEGETVGNYSVHLLSQPLQPVTVSLTASGNIFLDQTALVYDASNWADPQLVKVTPVSDEIAAPNAEGIHIGAVQHTITSTAPSYQLVSPITVTVTITDDDKAGIALSDRAVSISERGLTATVGIRLTSQPTQLVTLMPRTDGLFANPETLLAPNQLTFDATNWHITQTLTIAALDDALIEGTRTLTLTHEISSTDSIYNATSLPGVLISVADNDGIVEGLVFVDRNGNDALDDGELLAGVDVTLIAKISGATQNDAPVRTNNNGAYRFERVPAGSYELDFGPLAGLAPARTIPVTATVTAEDVQQPAPYMLIPQQYIYMPHVSR